MTIQCNRFVSNRFLVPNTSYTYLPISTFNFCPTLNQHLQTSDVTYRNLTERSRTYVIIATWMAKDGETLSQSSVHVHFQESENTGYKQRLIHGKTYKYRHNLSLQIALESHYLSSYSKYGMSQTNGPFFCSQFQPCFVRSQTMKPEAE